MTLDQFIEQQSKLEQQLNTLLADLTPDLVNAIKAKVREIATLNRCLHKVTSH